MGRRKRRVPCPVPECNEVMIYDRMVCDKCWKALPARIRKVAYLRWKAIKPFVDQKTNMFICDPDDHMAEILFRKHIRNCDLLAKRLGIPEDQTKIDHEPETSGIEAELEELGLL